MRRSMRRARLAGIGRPSKKFVVVNPHKIGLFVDFGVSFAAQSRSGYDLPGGSMQEHSNVSKVLLCLETCSKLR